MPTTALCGACAPCGDGDLPLKYPPARKVFDSVDVSRAAVRMAYARIGAESLTHFARLVGAPDVRTVRRWMDGEHCASSGYLRRLLRLCLWRRQDWQVSSWQRVDWAGLAVPGQEGDDDPFVVRSKPVERFPFGGPQEQADMIGHVKAECGTESWGRLLRLLGKTPSSSSYTTLRRWRGQTARVSPRYLARLLALAAWPDAAVGLRDVWRIDWRARRIELAPDFAVNRPIPAELTETGFTCLLKPARPSRRRAGPPAEPPPKKRRVRLPPPGPPILVRLVIPSIVPWAGHEAKETADTSTP